MKVVFVVLFFFQSFAFSQCDTTNAVDFPEIDASFPGGAAQMKRFIQENIEYPELDQSIMESGRIYIEFIVCQDGSITNVTFRREVTAELEKMSIELISKMPNWIPAEDKGEKVASRCRLPITICFQ